MKRVSRKSRVARAPGQVFFRRFYKYQSFFPSSRLSSFLYVCSLLHGLELGNQNVYELFGANYWEIFDTVFINPVKIKPGN